MTRDEHVRWARDRAFQYLDAGDLDQALASMTSDLSNHPQTEDIARSFGPLGFIAYSRGPVALRAYISGFTEGILMTGRLFKDEE